LILPERMVVSDTTPITTLLKADQADLLPNTFGSVTVPGAVFEELRAFHAEVPSSTFLPRSKQRHSELRVSDQLIQCERCPPITNHFSPFPAPSPHLRRSAATRLSSPKFCRAIGRRMPDGGESLLCVRFSFALIRGPYSRPFAVIFCALCALSRLFQVRLTTLRAPQPLLSQTSPSGSHRDRL
jgi:hypothetical protein